MSMELSLTDARDSLDYWERRAERLPRRQVRARREALDMAERWRARVAQVERETYGRGLIGLLLVLLSEGRVPEPVRHTGRQTLRYAVRAVKVTVAATVVVVLAAMVVVLATLAQIADALL